MSSEDDEWSAWKTKFGKTYSSPEEEVRRRELWNATKKMVEEHNAKHARGETTFSMAVNHFADLEDHERKRYCGVLRNKKEDNK